VTGKVPTSWVKVMLAVLLGFVALGGALYWLKHHGRLR
jgi:hypothetical protein